MHKKPTDRILRIIVNPAAGKGRGAHVAPQVERYLKDLDLEYEIVFTERRMHAAELARDAALKGYRGVVSVGGDGTSNEVVNGLMAARARRRRSCVMGVLRVGTGNDFAHGAGVPTGIRAECEVLAAGHKRKIDLAKVTGGDYPEGRYFCNGIGIGFDSRVGFRAQQLTWGIGAIPYVVGALSVLAHYPKAPLLRLEFGNTVIEERLPQVSVMNGTRLGGAFKMAPRALMDDGLLDLCIVQDVGRLHILYLIGHYVFGTQHGRSKVIGGRTRSIDVTALDGSLAIHADGETICTAGKKVRIEVVEKALEILCPTAP
jgi:diacylglycerol kinase (ATP)